MNSFRRLRLIAWLCSFCLVVFPLKSIAEDIDIFVGSSAGSSANPNVLIVLDNTSNWSRANQKWPGGEQQGQAEVSAIKTVIQTLDSTVNVGLMEFVTDGNANDNGGFIRYAIRSMTGDLTNADTTDDGNKGALSTILDTIYNNITSSNEKRNSGTAYGNLMYDVYNYFAGANQSQAGAGTPTSLVDAGGYATAYSRFLSPISCSTNCAKNFIIFISNPDSSGPTHDDSPGTPGNTTTLSGLGGTTSQLGLPNFTTTTTPTTTAIYQTYSCYASQSACNTAEATNTSYTSVCPDTTTGTYTSCNCAAENDATHPASSSLPACASGTRYGVVGTSNTQVVGPTAGSPTDTSGTSVSCYTNSTAANSAAAGGTDKGGLTCPTATTSTVGNVTTNTTYSCSYSAGTTEGSQSGCSGAPIVSSASSATCYGSLTAAQSAVSAGTERGGLTCPSGYTCTYSTTAQAASDSCTSAVASSYTLGSASAGTATNTTTSTTTCYAGAKSGNPKWSSGCSPSGNGPYTSCTDQAGMTCPATTTTIAGSTVTETTYSCSYDGANGSTSGCSSGNKKVDVTRTATPSNRTATVHNYTIQQTATPTSGGSTYHFPITQSATPSVTTTTTGTFTTLLGNTLNCYADIGSCNTSDYSGSCASYSGGCACSTTGATTSAIACLSGKSYQVVGNSNVITNTANGTYTTDTAPYNMDEWSRFLYQKGVPLSSCDNQKVTSYTIDVYNAQPNATNTALMMSAARNGGGKYFNATNKSMLVNALKDIFQEIQSVNSTFASASLPINATNRSQNENQVYIGMFRPDPDALPRWFGNVKRYQLIKASDGSIQLGDVNGNLAINNNTGFITDCATSWWTSDSPNPPGGTSSSGYWSAYTTNPTPAGKCTTTSYNAYSDSPDGPRVEKGAVAEVIRKGNDPSATDTTPTWLTNRTLYTSSGVSGTTLLTFNTTNSGLSETLVKWTSGQDTEDENANGALGSQTPTVYATETRASIHGDVVHSRPLPVNYGSSGVVVYYGTNDGTYRAVSAADGKEKWAFVAPEFNAKLDRLRAQSPKVAYPSVPTTLSPTPTKRDYFFDGSTGLYQNADNSKIWIYPTMRRGGRMVYAFDVTSMTTPILKWKFGCNDSDECVGDDADKIGQTWSIPNIAFIKGYSTTVPTAVFGGGYHSCEDDNSTSPSCSDDQGKMVFILNAFTGEKIKSFETLGRVASDIALIDMDYDNKVDYGYFGDTLGNVYRISFSSYDSSTGNYSSLSSSEWHIRRIAYTTGGARKFLFAPAVFGGAGNVWLAMGSGDREHPLESHYPYSTPVTNRFYVYRDCLPSPSPTSSSTTGGDNLDDTSIMTGSTATSPAACNADKTLASNCSTNKGWFISLNNGTGEQTVTSAVISGGMVAFSTNRPIASSAGSCAQPLGEARGYWLDLYNGSGAIGVSGTCGGTTSTTFVGGGLPPSPVIGTVTINGVPTSVVIGAAQKSGGASSPIAPQKATPTNLPARKRVYSIIKSDN